MTAPDSPTVNETELRVDVGHIHLVTLANFLMVLMISFTMYE
jgi:hypothetical protein